MIISEVLKKNNIFVLVFGFMTIELIVASSNN